LLARNPWLVVAADHGQVGFALGSMLLGRIGGGGLID